MTWRCTIAILLASLLAAEVIDRIAVSVGNRVITEADLDRELRITAFLNRSKLDFSPANKRETASRLVDQALVRNELEAARYPAPTAAETSAALAEEKAALGGDAAYRKALVDYGISEDDLKARLAWQWMLVRFIDIRFRPGVQISDADLEKYFDEHLRAAWVAAHPGQTPTLEAYRDAAEKALTGQEADQQVEQWLKEARRRTRIQYREEVFQ